MFLSNDRTFLAQSQCFISSEIKALHKKTDETVVQLIKFQQTFGPQIEKVQTKILEEATHLQNIDRSWNEEVQRQTRYPVLYYVYLVQLTPLIAALK